MTRTGSLLGASATIVVLSLSGCGSSNSSAGPGSDFCNGAKSVQSTLDAFASFFTTTPSLSDLKAAIQAATNAVDSTDSAAPSDISADTHKLRTALDGANSKVQSANDVTSAGAALTALNTSDYTATGDRVDAYVKSHCGFSINSTSSGSSAGSSSSTTTTETPTTTTDTGSSSTNAGSSSSTSS